MVSGGLFKNRAVSITANSLKGVKYGVNCGTIIRFKPHEQ